MIAFAGGLAAAAQVAVYTYLGRYEVAGQEVRRWTTHLSGGRFSIRYPNTWAKDLKSKTPEFRLDLSGPRGITLTINASEALLAALDEPREEGKDPLRILHKELKTSLPGLEHLSEEVPEASGLLPGPSFVSFFSGARAGENVRGFRFTMAGPDRVWTIVAACPRSLWNEARPVLQSIVSSVEVS